MATLAVDFDGVIHAYSRGWQDGSIYDDPMPGAIEGLRALQRSYAVFIHTTRDPEQVLPWLSAHGIEATDNDACERCNGAGGLQEVDLDGRPTHTEDPCTACDGSGGLTFWNDQSRVLVTNRKLPALAYIDDRAVRFESWRQVLDELPARVG